MEREQTSLMAVTTSALIAPYIRAVKAGVPIPDPARR